MMKLLIAMMTKVNSKGGSNELLVFNSSCIALAVTTIVIMISESVAANAFKSDGSCLDLEGLKSDQQYLAGYIYT
jgi:hypothetical protein